MEDVTEIILNLKEINLKLIDTEESVINLSVEKDGVVTAGDIEETESVEVLNPEQPIATLSKKGKLDMESAISY